VAITDPVADMLTKIRNASAAGFEKVDIIGSKLKLEIVKILKNEGYVKNFKKVAFEGRNNIRVFLKYDEKTKPGDQRIEVHIHPRPTSLFWSPGYA
jgi:small subunit ribosomal protein S8